MQRVGLIAGNGRFPLIFARTARAEGIEVVAVAHEGETLPELAGLVDAITWIKVGELGRMIGAFHEARIDRAVMAGGIRKAALLEHFAPDERGMQFLARLGSLGDDTLLRGVAGELEGEGIHIVESTLFLSTPVPPRPTNTPVPTAVSYCDWAAFVKDVSVPDGTRLSPGETFTKIWRLQNRGTCTWTPDYMLVYTSGDPMGATTAIRLPGYVAPGQTVDMSITLTAPASAGCPTRCRPRRRRRSRASARPGDRGRRNDA